MPPSLRRVLGLTSATALVVSNMIGTGIFATTGFLAGDLGRPLLVLAIWAVGAVVALTGALAYAELAVNFPGSGGEYVYLREAWGPAWGFLSGWSSFFAGFSAPLAAAALAFAEYLGQVFPSLSSAAGDGLMFRFLRVGVAQRMSILVILVFTLINLVGVGLAAKVQNFLTSLKVAVLAVFLSLAFTVGRGSWTHFRMAASRTSAHGLGAQFAVSLIFVMFAYSGWNAATYVAEETRQPGRTLPRALVSGTVLVAVFYLALNAVFIYALPLESLKGVVPVGAKSAAALFGGRIGSVFSGIMALMLLSCVSAMCLVAPRVYYAMAQDGCFFRSAARVDAVSRTPMPAIAYQAAAAAVMIVTASFAALLYYIGFTLIFFNALAVLGLVRMRHRPGWQCLRSVSRCYPVIPVVFLLASVWMLLWAVAVRPRESFLGLLTVACGWLLYRFAVAPAAASSPLFGKGRGGC